MKSDMEKVVTDCPTNVEKWTKTLDEFHIDPYDVQAFLLNDLAELLERISVCPGGLHAISDATFMGIGSELARNEFMLNVSMRGLERRFFNRKAYNCCNYS
jgi:hypothetical protein